MSNGSRGTKMKQLYTSIDSPWRGRENWTTLKRMDFDDCPATEAGKMIVSITVHQARCPQTIRASSLPSLPEHHH